MTAQELVSEIWGIGVRYPMSVRMEKAVALVEKFGEERWQEGYNSGWAHCESDKGWRKVEANL